MTLATCFILGLNIFTLEFIAAEMFSFLVILKKQTAVYSCVLIFRIAQTIDLGDYFSLGNTCYWFPILGAYLAVNFLVLKSIVNIILLLLSFPLPLNFSMLTIVERRGLQRRIWSIQIQRATFDDQYVKENADNRQMIAHVSMNTCQMYWLGPS